LKYSLESVDIKLFIELRHRPVHPTQILTNASKGW